MTKVLRQILLILIGTTFFYNLAKGQSVSGKVTYYATGKPVVGANITVKGVNYGTITDSEGNYKLKIDSTCEILCFSHVECNDSEIEIGNDTIIDVRLKYRTTVLNIFEITAYVKPHKKRISMTGEIIEDEDSILKIEKVWHFSDIDSAVANHLYKNISYPDSAIFSGFQAKLFVYFTIDINGNLIDSEFKRNIYPSLESEILTTLKSMPTWDIEKVRRRYPLENIDKYYPREYLLPIRYDIIKEK